MVCPAKPKHELNIDLLQTMTAAMQPIEACFDTRQWLSGWGIENQHRYACRSTQMDAAVLRRFRPRWQ